MILQALNSYFDCLVESGILEQPGWQPVKVHFALQIDDEGNLKRVMPLMHEEQRGKKTVMLPQILNVPVQEKRSVGILSNFLCDNATYVLGLDSKGKPDRAMKCFQACRELHKGILQEVSSPAARAVTRFFEKWEPEHIESNDILKPFLKELQAGANLVFDYQNEFVQNDPEIRRIWNEHYSGTAEGDQMQCLVTGKTGPVARLHPSIKGVAGGQAMGTSLVSFNASAFESFGRDGAQGYNAPVSEKAAFAYAAALNYMIAREHHHIRLSDTTIVFWAEHGEDIYADAFSGMMGDNSGIDEEDLYKWLGNLAAGRKVDAGQMELKPEEHFYVLGLAPNAARLSVRFFLQDDFGQLAKNMLRHHERLQIVKPSFDTKNTLSFWHLLNETVNQKARDKMPSPLLAGSLVRAVLLDLPYPRLMLDQIEIRIRAEKDVNRVKAAMIKAYLLKLAEKDQLNEKCEEALCMELNQDTTYPPYLLGRLFAVLEGLQQAANPGINTTIRDRFFNSACATPAIVFPQLIKLAQSHLKKLDKGKEVYYSKQMGEIMAKMDKDYPARLNLYDQGIFQLGYYHQTQTRYMKKEEKENA